MFSFHFDEKNNSFSSHIMLVRFTVQFMNSKLPHTAQILQPAQCLLVTLMLWMTLLHSCLHLTGHLYGSFVLQMVKPIIFLFWQLHSNIRYTVLHRGYYQINSLKNSVKSVYIVNNRVFPSSFESQTRQGK